MIRMSILIKVQASNSIHYLHFSHSYTQVLHLGLGGDSKRAQSAVIYSFVKYFICMVCVAHHSQVLHLGLGGDSKRAQELTLKDLTKKKSPRGDEAEGMFVKSGKLLSCAGGVA